MVFYTNLNRRRFNGPTIDVEAQQVKEIAEQQLSELLASRSTSSNFSNAESIPPQTVGNGFTENPHADKLPQQFGAIGGTPSPSANTSNNNFDFINATIPPVAPPGNNVPFENPQATVRNEVDNPVGKAAIGSNPYKPYNPNQDQQNREADLKTVSPNLDQNSLPSQNGISLPWWLRAAGHIAPVAAPLAMNLPSYIADETSDSRFAIDAGLPIAASMAAGSLYRGKGINIAGRNINPNVVRGGLRIAGMGLGMSVAPSLSGKLPMGGYEKPDTYARELNRAAMNQQINPSDYAYEMDKVIQKKREDSPESFSPYYGQLAQQSMVNQLLNSQSRPYTIGF